MIQNKNRGDKKRINYSFEYFALSQLDRILWLTQMDFINGGKQWVMTADNKRMQVIRDDYSNAYMNSVQALFHVCKYRIDKINQERKAKGKKTKYNIGAFDTLDQAKANFLQLILFLHNTGFLSKKTLSVRWRFDDVLGKEEQEKTIARKYKDKIKKLELDIEENHKEILRLNSHVDNQSKQVIG